MGRVMAVDPGDVRIGIALSDISRTLARPLSVIQHVSRLQDAEKIMQIASENEVDLIVVGLPLDDDGEIGPQGRKSIRLVEQLKALSTIEIKTWDESGSTEIARNLSKDRELIDARAAAVILQDYLNALPS